jgi:putative peptidoglycan lipid II flippase
VTTAEPAASGAESSAGIARSSALMASGTVLSRLTGVVRTSAIAAAVGFATFADTYTIANSLPNIVYILIVGGAINSVFVPQLVRHMKSDPDGGDGYADRLLTLVGLILLAVTVSAVVLAPWIIRLYSPRNWSATDLHVSTLFAYFLLPQIFFYGLYTMLQQVLNARGSFGPPMFAPIVNNVVVIGAALAFIGVVGTNPTSATVTNNQVIMLGVLTTVGVLAQSLVLIPAAWRVGYKYKPRFDFRGQGLGKAGSLAGWTIGFVLVNQITLLIVTRLSAAANVTLTHSGDVNVGFTSYQNAYLTFILPQSVITVSLVTALLPALSRAAQALDFATIRAHLGNAMRIVAVLLTPIAAMLFVEGPRITQLLFARGSASVEESIYTGYVLSAFVVGLVPFGLYYVLLRGYYSLENTRTPFWLTVGLNITNLAIAVPLYLTVNPQYRVIVLALAFSLAYVVWLVVSWRMLSKVLDGLETYETVRTMVRATIASIPCGLLTWVVMRSMIDALPSGFVTLLLSLAVASAVGIGVFVGLAWVMRINEVRNLPGIIRRRSF